MVRGMSAAFSSSSSGASGGVCDDDEEAMVTLLTVAVCPYVFVMILRCSEDVIRV